MIALLRSPPGWFTLLLAAALVAYFSWLAIGGAAKIEGAGLAGEARHNVEIVLGIEPEQFHMTRLQAAGRLIRFEQRSAFIMDMPDAVLHDLARNYWVEAIRPWAGLTP